MTKRLLVYLLVALASFFSVGLAHAQAIYWRAQGNGHQANGFSPEQSCMTLYTKFSGYTYAGIKDLSATDARCMATQNNAPGYPAAQVGYTEKKTCPATEPYFDKQKGMCVSYEPPPDPPMCEAGVTGSGTWYRGETPEGPLVYPPMKGGSNGKCEIDIIDVTKCYKGTDGKAYCVYVWKQTGAAKDAGPAGSSSAGPAPAPVPQPAPDGRQDVPPQSSPGGCPKGTVQGGVDSAGIPICIGTGSEPKNSPPPPPKIESSKSEPTPDGGTKTTDTTTTKNSDGSTTTETKTTTTAPDGTKTITVTKDTSTALSGGAGKDDSKRDDEKYDLCKQNPHLTICRNSSVSGTCGEISCEGDAIQCATLRAAAAMQCQQQKDLEDLAARGEVAAGNAILGGTDPMKGAIDSALKGTEVDMSQPNLDAGGFVSSRACLAPRSFAVAGKSITVDFGELCDSIEALRYAVLACAWIVAYLIVSRSVLNS